MTRVHAQRLSWRMGATYAGQTAASQRMDFAARFEEMEVLFTQCCISCVEWCAASQLGQLRPLHARLSQLNQLLRCHLLGCHS